MTLVVEGRPSNLHLPPEALHAQVEGDVYRICDRLKEVSPRLNVILADHKGTWAYIIMERCEDGVERKIFMTHELSEATVVRARAAMATDLKTRLVVMEKEQREHEAAQRDEELERMYEKFGREMWHRFEKDGFIENRPISYPKAGVAGPRVGAGK